MGDFHLFDLVYLLITLIIIWIVITAWENLLRELFTRFSGLDPDTVFFKLVLAIFFTAIAVFMLFFINEEVKYFLGISST